MFTLPKSIVIPPASILLNCIFSVCPVTASFKLVWDSICNSGVGILLDIVVGGIGTIGDGAFGKVEYGLIIFPVLIMNGLSILLSGVKSCIGLNIQFTSKIRGCCESALSLSGFISHG